jgi:hypothetical protein
MIFDKTESHVRVPAKIAIDFLRNSRSGVFRNSLQREAQRFCPTLEIREHAVTVLLLIVICAGIPVAHSVAKSVVK